MLEVFIALIVIVFLILFAMMSLPQVREHPKRRNRTSKTQAD